MTYIPFSKNWINKKQKINSLQTRESKEHTAYFMSGEGPAIGFTTKSFGKVVFDRISHDLLT